MAISSPGLINNEWMENSSKVSKILLLIYGIIGVVERALLPSEYESE